jgi:hypothetical protein
MESKRKKYILILHSLITRNHVSPEISECMSQMQIPIHVRIRAINEILVLVFLGL